MYKLQLCSFINTIVPSSLRMINSMEPYCVQHQSVSFPVMGRVPTYDRIYHIRSHVMMFFICKIYVKM